MLASNIRVLNADTKHGQPGVNMNHPYRGEVAAPVPELRGVLVQFSAQPEPFSVTETV